MENGSVCDRYAYIPKLIEFTIVPKGRLIMNGYVYEWKIRNLRKEK